MWIWYSGEHGSQRIPLKTLQEDCIDVWHVDVVDKPSWLEPEAKFRLDDWVTLVKISDDVVRPRRASTRVERIDLRGHDLKVFSIRNDYAACLVPGLQVLVLVPIKTIAQQGYRLRSRYDRILADDEFDDYEEYL